MNRKSLILSALTNSAFTCLIAFAGMAVTGCLPDSKSLVGAGEEILKGDSYMTAQVDGKPWSASTGAFFVNYEKQAKENHAKSGGMQITATNSLDEVVTFVVAEARPDSFPVGSLKFTNLAGYEKDGEAFLVRSGYIKITRVTDDHVEGVFELDMVADEDAFSTVKLLRFRNGQFKAGTVGGGIKAFL